MQLGPTMNSTVLTPPPSTITDPERYVLISWSSLSLLGSVFGNSLILLAKIRYKAIRLDKVSVELIKNIAVSDLMMGLFAVHPSLVALVYNAWPYGTLLCKITYYIAGPISYVAAVLQVCALHLNKIYTLAFPLRAVGRSRKLGYKICAVVWLLTALNPISLIAVDSSDVQFEYRAYRCMYGYSAPIWKRLLLSNVIIFNLLPNIIVAVTTVSLMVIVKRARGRVNKQGIFTALYVGLAYLIANGPLSFYIIFFRPIISRLTSSPEEIKFYGDKVYTFVSFIMFLNCFANCFVYYRSVMSFKLFVRHMFSYLPKKISTSRSFNRAAEVINLRVLSH